MVLSKCKLQIGVLLVSVNGNCSYNPDLIGRYCQRRPSRLEFSQPVYPDHDETLQHELDGNNSDFPLFTNDDIHQGWERRAGPFPTGRELSNVTVNPVDNGIYLAGLGISLADWLMGLGCGTCLSLFNHYRVFTIAQLFCSDITSDSLAEVRASLFGHNMTTLQNKRIAAAADGVYSVFDALANIVNKVSSEDWRTTSGLRPKVSLKSRALFVLHSQTFQNFKQSQNSKNSPNSNHTL
jgi:hypothetical protein